MESNVQIVEDVYEAFGRGDVDAVLGAMDANVDWQEPASLPWESQSTPQGVAENVFGPITTLLNDFSATPREVHDAGDVVVAIGTYRGKGASNGVELEAEFAHVFRFKGDKIVGFRDYTDTHQWLQALGKE